MKNYPLKIMLPALVNTLLGRVSPVKVGIQLTKECNLKCLHCYNNEASSETLTVDEIYSAISALKKMNISILALTGGEPMMREEHTEIIEYAVKKKNILTGLATNATMIDEGWVRKHKNAGLHWYHLSFDSAKQKEYDAFREEGAYECVINTMRLAKNYNIDVIATTVLMKENIDALEEIINKLIDYEVKIWSPTIIIPCGRGKEYFKSGGLSKTLVMDAYESIFKLSQKYKEKINVYPMDSQIYYPYKVQKSNSIMTKLMSRFMGGCSVTKGTTIHIEHDGKIKPCAYFSGFVPNVNIKNQSIEKIFRENDFLLALRNKENLSGKCKGCEHIPYCGGCRSRANAMNNDPFSEDPYCFYK